MEENVSHWYILFFTFQLVPNHLLTPPFPNTPTPRPQPYQARISAKQRTKNSDKIPLSLITPNTLIINNYALAFQNLLFCIAKA